MIGLPSRSLIRANVCLAEPEPAPVWGNSSISRVLITHQNLQFDAISALPFELKIRSPRADFNAELSEGLCGACQKDGGVMQVAMSVALEGLSRTSPNRRG
jgi:hypothetical protein